MATRILIVDDHPDLRELMTRMLVSRGFEVETVTQGATALLAASTSHPDVIFLDVMMPDVDGLTVLEQLKGNPATAAIPVVVMTAQMRERIRHQALLAGAARFIGKPLTLGELISTIKAVLAEARAEAAKPSA